MGRAVIMVEELEAAWAKQSRFPIKVKFEDDATVPQTVTSRIEAGREATTNYHTFLDQFPVEVSEVESTSTPTPTERVQHQRYGSDGDREQGGRTSPLQGSFRDREKHL